MVYRPDGPRGTGRAGSYVGHHWYDDIVVAADEDRVLPVTVAHDVIATHRVGCACEPCGAYPEALKRRLKRAFRSAAPPPR